MRLEPESPPNTRDTLVGNAAALGHGASAPVGFIFGLGFQCQPHDLSDFFVANGSRSATAGQVKNSLQARVIKALAQLANGGLTKPDFLRDLLIVQPLAKEQDQIGRASCRERVEVSVVGVVVTKT